MREIPSEMEFHVFPAPTQSRWSLENSNRNAHDTGRDEGKQKLWLIHADV